MIKCEKCGREIKSIITNIFTYNGGDWREELELEECPVDAVCFDTDANWCGYELEEEEQREQIKCPCCHQYPFENKEIQIHEIVRVVMFKNNKGEEND